MHEDQDNIQKWIEGCRREKRHSQRLLYEHFYGYSMSVSLRYSKNRDEALEIMNDAWLKIFGKINQFNSQQSFKPWCRRILINSAIDFYRSKKGKMLFLDLEEGQDIVDINASMPDILPGEDMLPVLQKLPPAYRAVFNLYVIEEYKHQEISDILGISIGTSKSNLARAKDKLRKIILEQRENKLKSI